MFSSFFLTLLAGLSTGVGSFIAFLCRHTSRKFLSVALGFSAGVMIYVSMIEIFFKAQEALVAQMGHRIGSWITVAAFFGGMLVITIIDKLIPPGENPHEIRKIEDVQTKDPQPKRLMRMGIFTVLAIAIHNSIIVAYLDMISISTAPRVDGIGNGNYTRILADHLTCREKGFRLFPIAS